MDNRLNNESDTTGRQSRSITLRDLVVKTVSGAWPKIVIIVFVVELAFLIVGSTIPIPQSDINQISNQNSALGHETESLSFVPLAFFLFSNNFLVALRDFVPLFGWFIFALSTYDTALVIEVIGIASNIPGPLLGLVLLLQPHSWVELPAYAIATTQSFYLISTVAQRSRFKFEVARTGLLLLIVAAELLIAALFESSELSLLSYGLLADFAIPWLFFAVFVILLYLGRRRILRKYEYRMIEQTPAMPGSPQTWQQLGTASQANFSRFCGKCGARVQNPVGATFCEQCGQRLIQPNVGAYSSSAKGSTGLPPYQNP